MDPSELKAGDPCWFRTIWGEQVRGEVKGVPGIGKRPTYVVIIQGKEHHGSYDNTKPVDAVTRLGEVR